MSREGHVAELKRQLLDVLRQIETQIVQTARERCPYRAADDVCNFGFGCQNKELDRCTR